MAIRSLQIATVKVAGMIGYQIHGLYRDCSDSLWDVIAHAAVFRDKARAERFLARVRNADRIDWSFWGVPQGNFISGTEAIQSRVAPFSVL